MAVSSCSSRFSVMPRSVGETRTVGWIPTP